MASSLIKHLFVFGLGDGQVATDGELGQVGELGQCHVHVVLHTSGRSRPNPDVNSLIFNSYAIRSDRVENSDLIKFGPVDSQVAQDGEVGQVVELGHGHVHVVLHASGRSRPNPDVNSLIFNSYFNAYAYIRSDRVENSDPVKYVLLDVPGAQVGEVGHVGELGQCHGHVVLHTDLVEVDRIRT